jgi:hypothetical protein
MNVDSISIEIFKEIRGFENKIVVVGSFETDMTQWVSFDEK